ncbi:MAG: type IX secretion system membrane protein PorP/SprF [Flavobacteriales bacterium]|nr:type IX secretion system membrane protein PorP/SprF [Flavobacteriales bacterium]
MRSLLYILLFMMLALNSLAQQDPLFNKYMFNPLIINPAYAGSREALSMVLLHRSQWIGFDGAPETQTFSIHAPVAQKTFGIGATIIRDVIGPYQNFGISAIGAYRLKLGQGKLSFGLKGAAYNYVFDWNRVTYKDQEVHPLLSNNNYWVPTFDFGIRYHDRTAYAGVAFANLNQPSIGNTDPNNTLVADSITYGQKFLNNVTFTGGYAFELSNALVLKPSVLLKSSIDWKSTSFISTTDINVSILYQRTLWGGITYRTGFGMVFMLQYDVTHTWSGGVSYDFGIHKFRNVNSNSVEFFLRHDIPFRKSKVLSPRYF